jgi:hypothetical protein
MMRTATGFHTDYTGCPVDKVLKELGSLELFVEHLTRIRVDPVQLKYIFGNVDTIECSTVHGVLLP